MTETQEAVRLKGLIKARGILKSRQTHFKKYLDNILQENRDRDVKNYDRQLILEIESRVERHRTVLSDFDNIQNEIENLSDEVDLEVEAREEFESVCHNLLAVAKDIVTEFHKPREQINSDLHSNISVNVRNSSNSREIKLPDIELPKFGGDYGNFLEFRDLFDSLINSDRSLAEIQKFHYLRASLFGGAAQVIRSIEFTADNYELAWHTLCNRFHNRAILVDNHVRALFDLPVLTQESSTELRKMLDNISKHLRSLESLKQPVVHWDTLLLHIFSSKLDKKTAREWEEKRAKEHVRRVESDGEEQMDQGLLTLDSFKIFIKRKADLIETLELSRNIKQQVQIREASGGKSRVNSVRGSSHSLVANESVCVVCKGGHTIHNCPEFQSLSVGERVSKVKELRLCFNCLRSSHSVKTCKTSTCRKCRGKHHTLIHFEKSERVLTSGNAPSEPRPECQQQVALSVTESSAVLSSGASLSNNPVILQTAMVQILDSNGVPRRCRALLDGASQSNLITSKCAEKLGLPRHELPLTILGVGGNTVNLKHRCEVKVQSCVNAFEVNLSCIIIPSICAHQPSHHIDISEWKVPKHLFLADADFHRAGEIDLLIGAGVYLSLLCIGQLSLGPNHPTLQKTRFGWVLSGEYPSIGNSSVSRCHVNTNLDVQIQLSKFWEIEEPYHSKPSWSNDEKECEDIFVKTTCRDSEGKFIVRIPFKQPTSLLGDSRVQAFRRFRSLEWKLQRNPKLKEMYSDFIREYIQLGHMSLVNDTKEVKEAYYFPHHGVLNEKNQTTKLRVVFDGSAQSDTGKSLNDLQYVGPTIQDDLISILLRFRLYNIVICGDIVKMYRQIWINHEQRCLQRILWRFDPSEAIKEYELNTVTYGNASSPFLAVRCLQQLSKECVISYPRVSKVIERDFYMDDIISGTYTVQEAISLCEDLQSVLKSGGFELQKWASNSEEVLQHIKQSSDSVIIKIGEKDKTKTLGLDWVCSRDVLMYHISEPVIQKCTKRVILSEISLIFDPLGLLAPTIILAKIILQKLWMNKLSWDEGVPMEINTRWQAFRQQLGNLNSLQIPRQIICRDVVYTEIHGFADASLEAYGACIYVRSVNERGESQVQLLLAKSKVAPLKTITIPKLELCGALVLAQLIQKIKISMPEKVDGYFLWCDSTVCLSWIKTQPNLLQTFVSNRVSQIQSLTNPSDWYYIRTKENPADLLSRGVMPSLLQNSKLWWGGPTWLTKSREFWPVSVFEFELNLPEMRKAATVLKMQEIEYFPFHRFSTLIRLKRVTAYCLRFLNNCRSGHKVSGSLSVSELNKAMELLVRLSQSVCFANELKILEKGEELPRKNGLLKLNPFLDDGGILRVGGRLELSNFSFEKKHPALLQGSHYLTTLIFRSEHLRLLHAGPQMLLARVRDVYWPIRGRVLARRIVHECIRCFRNNPSQKMPIMGMLPEARVTCASPFQTTGVDYAGPYVIKDRKGRGSKTSKCYIVVFVCFSTKCVHLELVSDLTSEAFLATFQRFISRRAAPSHIYSDNGTTFVGARNELSELGKFLIKNRQKVIEFGTNEGVQWHFIPAYSPHMGGLWEAGVKSCKKHLKGVLGNAIVTFEGMYTVLTQIEAILNSRPLTPLSSDPNDLTALTPSHFLIGKPLTTIPSIDVKTLPENRLSNFQRLQKMQQQFWSRWSREYLSQLQIRVKWRSQQSKVKTGDLVLIRDDCAPPLRWELGRVTDLHTGPDGIVRVVSVKTQRGNVRRALSKICVLPLVSDNVPSREND